MFWRTKKIENKSVKCARERERYSSIPEGARTSRLTANGDEWHRCLRGGGSDCEQPGGGFARVFEGGRCAGGRWSYRREGRGKIRTESCGLNRGDRAVSGRDFWAKVEDDVGTVKWVPLSARKGEEEDTVSGEKEAAPWANPGFGPNISPWPFSLFPFSFPFSILKFICEILQKHSKKF
jgi:hypothetical protein